MLPKNKAKDTPELIATLHSSGTYFIATIVAAMKNVHIQERKNKLEGSIGR